MVIRKTLHRKEDVLEIKRRIVQLQENTDRKWGKMTSSQMLRHCDKILQVSLGKITLPKINILIKAIGTLTKIEMKFFNNGIPPNMPSFKEVNINENCNFEKSRHELLETIDEFTFKLKKNNLISEHALFGKMTKKDWGFMEYKHLDHHLKQFKV